MFKDSRRAIEEGEVFKSVGQKFRREPRLCAQAQHLGAPNPLEGVSFGELASVRQTPRTSPLRTLRRRLGRLSGEKWVKERACGQSVASSTAGRAEARDPLCQDSRWVL